MRCDDLSFQLYAFSLIFTGMLESVHIPQTVIAVRYAYYIRMKIKRHFVIAKLHDLPISCLINQLRTLIDCFYIVSQIQLFRCFITTIKDNRFRMQQLIVNQGAHIIQINFKRGGIHSRKNLNQQPVKGVFYIHKAI